MNTLSQNAYEVALSYMFNEHRIGCVLHSRFDENAHKVIFLVPGLFGDRCDTRALFVALARKLASKGYNVVRFDFIGGGINLGDYTINDFSVMTDTLVYVIERIQNQFPWLTEIGLVGFSEGGKLCVKASQRVKIDFLGFCNALLQKEDLLLPIKRPRIINSRLAYDSEFGSWTNFNIVESYNDWLIEDDELIGEFIIAAVYSDSDPLTARSLELLRRTGTDISLIKGADHLFTNDDWCQRLYICWSDILEQNWPSHEENHEYETYILYHNENIAVKVRISAPRAKTLLFIHGLGQNKSGPSFLYSDLAYAANAYNCIFFDFIGAGDSTGETSSMDYDDYIDQISFMILKAKEILPESEIVLVASGIANVYALSNDRANECQKVLICPQASKLWEKICVNERDTLVINTHDLFEKYSWAEEEFRILGNVYNRAKGMLIKTTLLKDIYTMNSAIEQYCSNRDMIYITTQDNAVKHALEVNDHSHLLMSARERTRAIAQIIQLLGTLDDNAEKVNSNVSH